MSWPGSRRKQDETLLSVTIPALCQEQRLLSAGLVPRPATSQTAHMVSDGPSLEDGNTQLTAQHEPGRCSGHTICAADTSAAKRYE